MIAPKLGFYELHKDNYLIFTLVTQFQLIMGVICKRLLLISTVQKTYKRQQHHESRCLRTTN